MCGILAIVGDNRYKEIPEALIERGRDDNGIYEDDYVQLIQTRLEITECDIELPYQNDKYVLLFNGEIYNYKQFGSNEYEAILNAYENARMNELDGQYAIIIYNKESLGINWFRDEFRIHELYEYEDENNLIIASNLRSLPEIEFNELQHRGYGNVAKQSIL